MFKYIKKILWIIPGVIFVVSQAFAQSPVWNCRIHTPPNPYIFYKDYFERLMWIDITNSENYTVPVYLHGEIKRNGKLIARANSNRINIPQGGKRITRNDIRKLTDEWWDPEIKKILTRSPVLPEGQYVACVYVYRWGTRQLLTKCCISFQSMPMSPPRLISPKDGAKVSTKYPLFQWAPPQPALRGITYELKIVKVYKGQTKEEAMESNPAWFDKKGIRTTSFRYPSSARPFKQGNPYAWQIRGDPGFIDPNLADGLKSEVWSFEIQKQRDGEGIVITIPAENDTLGSVVLLVAKSKVKAGKCGFWFSRDRKKWKLIGYDKNGHNGWMIEWNTYLVPNNGKYFLKAILLNERRIESKPIKIYIKN